MWLSLFLLLPLLNGLIMSAAKDIVGRRILKKSKLTAVVALLMFGNRLVIFVIVLCNQLAMVNTELDGRLHQAWIVLYHFLEVVLDEMMLDKVAHVVHSRGANVRTCTFQ